jgi:hypothetical protein
MLPKPVRWSPTNEKLLLNSIEELRKLVLVKNTIHQIYFWVYPYTYAYDTALSPWTGYVYG